MQFSHIGRVCLGAQPRFLLCAGSARRAGREILGGCGLPSPMGEGARRAGEGLPVGKIQVGPGWGAIFVIAGFFT